MKYRKLGDSDLNVSEISLGSWLTYGVGVEAEKARACLEEAFAQDINFIDTANIYGRGAAETFLGDALKGRPRDSYVLATKLYFPMTDSDFGLSRAQVEKQLDASLPLCADNGISQVVWSPLGQGVLSGKYDPEAPPPRDSRAASEEMGGFMDRLMQPHVLRAVQELKPIAEEAGLTLPQFALAWVLREPNVASAIIGASRPEQVRENAAASGVIVDTQLFQRAEMILDEALGGVTA